MTDFNPVEDGLDCPAADLAPALCLARCLAGGFAVSLAISLAPLPGHASPTSAPASPSQGEKRQQSSGTKQTRSRRSSRWVKTLETLFVPPTTSAPKSTANSATRSDGRCDASEAPIQAMIPPQGYGLSSRDRPAITLSLPATSAQQAALLFSSESGESEHRVRLSIPESSRLELPPLRSEAIAPSNLVQFQLPADNPGLMPAQRYRWSLVLICGETIEPDDPTFVGWIEYRPLTAAQQRSLAELSGKEKLRWYGERGYWYDMLQP